jgi:colicin import membrane protein
MDSKTLNVVLASTTALSLGAAGIYYYRASEAARVEQKNSELAEARVKELEADKKRLEAQIKEQQVKLDALLAQLSSAKDEAIRLGLQKQLEEEREKQKKLLSGRR